jgi:nitrilase
MSDAVDGPFKIAAVQTAPVVLDRAATIDKACRLTAEAAAQGARLVVFPEAFVPTYPFWVWFIPPGQTRDLRDLYTELLANSLTVPGPEVDLLCQCARQNGVSLAIGINEINAEASGTTLFNTLLFVGPDGAIKGKRRKLMPTAAERLVHGFGDGSTFDIVDLPVGKTSGLICWENYMPLARYAMWAWGAQIHLAPTWDRGEPWLSTLRHTAKEGRVYVVGCCSVMHRDDVPDRLPFKAKYLPADLEWLNPGDSAILDPDGKFLAGPVSKKAEILYAEVNPADLAGPRWQLDVAGHYGRPDVFELTVRRDPRPMVRIQNDTPDSEPFSDSS